MVYGYHDICVININKTMHPYIFLHINIHVFTKPVKNQMRKIFNAKYGAERCYYQPSVLSKQLFSFSRAFFAAFGCFCFIYIQTNNTQTDLLSKGCFEIIIWINFAKSLEFITLTFWLALLERLFQQIQIIHQTLLLNIVHFSKYFPKQPVARLP